MVIVVDLGDDVQSYAETFPTLVFPRPPTCPGCAAIGHLIGHGSYPRTVADSTHGIPIRIKRLFCTACHQTISLVPTFCLPWRHYATTTIQAVLTLRIETHASWTGIGRRFLPADLPTRTTVREWVAAFAHASTRYLPAVLRHLATWSPRSGAIEVALADIGEQSGPSAQLITAVAHLLGELRDVGVTVAAGSRRWLATLWQWGNSAKLGRLV